MKRANRKIINTVSKQGELLKRFNDAEEFFDRVGLSRSNIYFKISLYKFLRTFPSLKIQLLHLAILRAILRLLKKYVRQM